MIIKNIFISILLVCSLYSVSYSQNRIDNYGQKQGEWKEFEARPMDIGYTISNNNDEISDIEIDYDLENFQIYKLIGNYNNNYRVGKWSIYLPNNILLCIVNYRKGKIYGEFQFFYESGNVRIQGKIKNKKVVFVKLHSDAGCLIKEYELSTKRLVEEILK